MNLFFVTVIFYLLILLFITNFIKNKIVLIIILVWWGFWNSLSHLSLSGVFPINFSTQIMYFFFFSVTSLVAYLSQLSKFQRFNYHYSSKENNYLYDIILKLTCFFAFPVQLFFFLRALYIMVYIMHPSQYRNDVFGLNTGSSVLFFNSNSLSYQYALFVAPFQFVALFAGISFSLFKKKHRLLVFSLLLVIMDAIMMYGRFGFHYIIFGAIFYISIYFSINKGKKSPLRSAIYFSSIAFVLVAIVYGITYMKYKTNLWEFTKLFVITYHTESFKIFDVEQNNPNSILHQYTYGLATFGGIERYVLLILNKFGFGIEPQSNLIGGYLHQNFLIGRTETGDPLSLNAFGSIFFTFYKDGGYFAILIYAILTGMLIVNLSKSMILRDPYRFSLLIGVTYLFVYGIFQPVTTGPMLPAVFSIFFANQIIRFYFWLKS